MGVEDIKPQGVCMGIRIGRGRRGVVRRASLLLAVLGMAALLACGEETGNSDMEFVYVEGGTFTRGMTPEQVDAAFPELAYDEQWFESFRRMMGRTIPCTV